MRRILVISLLCILGAGMAASQTKAATDTKPPFRRGILLLAHGGSVRTWNEEVRHVADQVDLSIPTEIAFGMANKSTIQDGINRLKARGVTEIVAVPLFVSSHSSVIESTAYLLGLRPEAPADLKDFVSMGHGGSEPMAMSHDEASMGDAMKPVASPVPVRMTSALDHDTLVADILADRAASISKDPAHETVVLVAHGPVPDEDNKLWLSDMNSLAARIRKRSSYADIQCLTLRDDADEPVRNAATAELRAIVENIHKAGNTPLIVPLLLSYGGIEAGLRKRLDGLDFKMPSQALLPDSRIVAWVIARFAYGAEGVTQP